MDKGKIAKAILAKCEIATERDFLFGRSKPILDKITVSLLGVVICETNWRDEITEQCLVDALLARYCETGLSDIYDVAVKAEKWQGKSGVPATLEIEKLRRKLDWTRPIEFAFSN